jgi:hypothetical protein
MANIIGATFYFASTQICCDCAEKRLSDYGLACDEIKEVLGYQSRSVFSRLWDEWPIRYEHGKEYGVYFLEVDNYVEYTSYRGNVQYWLDMSAFTEQDNDSLIYISTVNGVPTASKINNGDSYVLTERSHYVEDRDRETITRVLAKTTALTDLRDIEHITDEYDTRGEMLTCESCDAMMIEEYTIDCYNCDKTIAHGHTAYDIEYGNSLDDYNGMPRVMRLCLRCELNRRQAIDNAIMSALMQQHKETGSRWYALYTGDIANRGFYEVYEEVKHSESLIFAKLNQKVKAIIEKAYYDETTESLAKFKETCTSAIVRLDRKYDYDSSF